MNESFSVFYTSSALKDLRNIEKKDTQKIILAVQKYANGNPLIEAKKLQGNFDGLYRYRVGNYRVIFEINNNKIYILKIKHRRDIYRRL